METIRDEEVKVGMYDAKDDKERDIIIVKSEKGGGKMQLSTTYMENLPSQSYKTKQFTRSISETLPDDVTKDELMKRAERQALTVETLVKNDIARHLQQAEQ